MRSSKKRAFGRRRFLQAAGLSAGALALPFTDLGRAAAIDGPPRRLVIVFTPNGPVMREWARATAGGVALGACLIGPLAEHLDRLVFFRGMPLGGRPLSDERGRGGPHQRALGALLTGQPLQSGNLCGGNGCSERGGWPAGSSVDQHIAQALATRDDAPPFPSVELGVRVTGGGLSSRLCFAGLDRPVPPENDPYRAYDRIFGGLGDPRARTSVLDVVSDELRALRRRVSGPDADMLDAHVGAIADLEHRLGIGAGACSAPALPAGVDPLGTGITYRDVGWMQMDVLTAALACDRTRVATLAYSIAASPVTFDFFPNPITARHHQLTHTSGTDGELVRIYNWYGKQVAHLLTKLATTPDPHGGMLLDDTLVLWAPELSEPRAHLTSDMPFVLAGGGITGNRVIDMRGRYHNDLLAGLCHWMGVPVDGFGHERFRSTPFTV